MNFLFLANVILILLSSFTLLLKELIQTVCSPLGSRKCKYLAQVFPWPGMPFITLSFG